MAALACEGTHPAETPPHRNLLLRVMDAIAEQQMRHAHHAIRLTQGARMTSVAQPSSTLDRSSTSPCDR